MKIYNQKLALSLIAIFTAFVSFAQNPGTVKSFTKIGIDPGSLLDDPKFNVLGFSMCFLSDMDGDGNKELITAGSSSGDAYLYLFKLTGSGQVKPGYTRMGNNEGNINIPGITFSDFAKNLTNIGDLDGNGVDDIVAGTLNQNYIVTIYLNASGVADSFVQVKNGLNGYFESPQAGDRFGSSVANIGDLDNDGVNDLAVGNENEASGKGSVTILFMRRNGRVKSYIKLSDGNHGFPPQGNLGFVGSSIVSVGDLNVDGNEDVLVGCDEGLTPKGGAGLLLFMNSDGTVKSYYKYEPTTSSFPFAIDQDALLGYSVANIGDINGDTITDVAISAPFYDTLGNARGRVYIMMLNRDGSTKAFQVINGYKAGFNGQLDEDDMFGYAMEGMGDFNKDHIYDLAISSPGDDGPTPGNNLRNGGAIYFMHLNGIPVTTSVGDVFTNENKNLLVYPNPTANDLTIRTKNNELINELSIFDALGKRVQHMVVKSPSTTFNVSSLSPGQYYIKIGSVTGIATVQFLKK